MSRTRQQFAKIWEAIAALGGGPGGPVAWNDVTGKPSTFPPESHAHAISDTTGLQTALDGKQPLATVLTNTTASFTTAQETKLSGIATGATVGATWGVNLGSIPSAVSGTTASFTTVLETKLNGIASGATVGATWGSNISGQPSIVGQAEAEAGTATTERIWTAQRVAQAIAALASGGGAVIRSARLTAQRTTTANTFSDVTDLSVSIGAGETWSFEAALTCGCNNTGGGQFTVTVPSGATLRLMVQGNTSSATAWTGASITASGGNTVNMVTANAQNRLAFLSGTVVNGANAGAIQVRFRAVTSGQTVTVDAGSYITGRKH